MYPILYWLIFAFHPQLKIDKITAFRSFLHSLEQLIDASYLNHEMFKNLDSNTDEQLKDAMINAANKSKKYAISKMFSTEL